MANHNYDNIPEELRWDRNWCLAGPDEDGRMKAPYSFGPRGIFKIKPTDPTHWKDLETIIEAAAMFRPCGLGYILSTKDEYTVIDLDVKNQYNEPDPAKWTKQEDINRYMKIIEKFDSYTERSTSGQGWHIWVKGDIGAGCKRDGVEVYSRERFIICTGDVYKNKDIEYRQDLLDILVSEIRSKSAAKVELNEIEETETDEVILERARNAENSDKFNALFNSTSDSRPKAYDGTYTALGYSTQSEADLALMSMFTFYTKSNAQVRRLFRMSGLGQRKKATKDDRYLNFTLALIRGREAIEDEADAAAAESGKRIVEQLMANYKQVTVDEDDFDYPPGMQVLDFNFGQNAQPVQLEAIDPPPADSGLPWPPGVAGQLAYYMYQGSVRPIKEVSIVAALGLLAGMCGKAFNIPQSGLNIYVVLIAKSAIGKEAMHGGIANMLAYMRDSTPNSMNFVDFIEYASGPALSKAVAANPCFVNVSGEWGRKLRRLAMEDGREGPMQSLRTVMTNLYQKSGPKSIVGGIGYSNKEQNIASVSGVAYSMIGESTPNTFYDALTDTMMEDGFLSRFTIIEYIGDRPPQNKHQVKAPDPSLLDHMCAIAQRALDLNEKFQTQEVGRSTEAEAILEAFNLECDDKINGSEDEGFRQMWNRAHLKAYRIAALLAVADNCVFPMIERQHAEWALQVIRRDIGVMSRRINSGDVGVGDASRERKLLDIIKKYLRDGAPASYGVPATMRPAAVVPRKYLQICTQRASNFTSTREGQTRALDNTLRSLIDSGYLAELNKEKALKDFNFQGKCYRVIHVPMNTEEERDVRKGRQDA
jgi:hypothetical protein